MGAGLDKVAKHNYVEGSKRNHGIKVGRVKLHASPFFDRTLIDFSRGFYFIAQLTKQCRFI